MARKSCCFIHSASPASSWGYYSNCKREIRHIFIKNFPLGTLLCCAPVF